MATDPKQLSTGESSGGYETFDIIKCYVCPNKNCKSYYGSSSMGKIQEEWNRQINTREKTTKRSTCPFCKTERQERYARLIPHTEVASARAKAVSHLPVTLFAKDKA